MLSKQCSPQGHLLCTDVWQKTSFICTNSVVLLPQDRKDARKAPGAKRHAGCWQAHSCPCSPSPCPPGRGAGTRSISSPGPWVPVPSEHPWGTETDCSLWAGNPQPIETGCQLMARGWSGLCDVFPALLSPSSLGTEVPQGCEDSKPPLLAASTFQILTLINKLGPHLEPRGRLPARGSLQLPGSFPPRPLSAGRTDVSGRCERLKSCPKTKRFPC